MSEISGMSGPLYRPTALLALLQRLDTAPKKGLSQNFLIDGNILRKMVKAAAVKSGELVVEIGPGPGALTESLLGCGAHVIAIERDAVFAEALQQLPRGNGVVELESESELEVFCSDILEFPLVDLLMRYGCGNGKRAKVVANLPYHLTSPILGMVLPCHELISTVHVMVQEEVGRRLVASPGSKEYGALSLFVRLYGKARYCFGVSRHCFMPAPRVDSAVIGIALEAPPPDVDDVAFLELVHAAFGQRRKTLRNALKGKVAVESVDSALQTMGIGLLERGEALSFEQFVELYRLLRK